jgi:vacuolar-type H+-ATPase subunit I/STV1
MAYKKEIETLLVELKLINPKYDRRWVERELQYSEKYIDQQLSKGGNLKLLQALQRLQKAIREQGKEQQIVPVESNQKEKKDMSAEEFIKALNRVIDLAQITVRAKDETIEQLKERLQESKNVKVESMITNPKHR